MPDSVLLALATECPTSESEVVEQAQQAVHATDEAIEDADPSADLQQALPLHVEEQASHVSNFSHTD